MMLGVWLRLLGTVGRGGVPRLGGTGLLQTLGRGGMSREGVWEGGCGCGHKGA